MKLVKVTYEKNVGCMDNWINAIEEYSDGSTRIVAIKSVVAYMRGEESGVVIPTF